MENRLLVVKRKRAGGGMDNPASRTDKESLRTAPCHPAGGQGSAQEQGRGGCLWGGGELKASVLWLSIWTNIF